MTYGAEAKISKTGYRTEFEANFNYFESDDAQKEGNVKIKLNKSARGQGKSQ